jgi:integrase/recombinase XerD
VTTPTATTTTDRLDQLVAEHETWLGAERGLRPNTLAAYRRDLRAYAAFLRKKDVDDPAVVDEGLVLEYVATLERARTEDDERRYSPASIARMVVAVRSFHRFCVDEGAAARDPTDDLRAPRVPLGIPKALDRIEVEHLLEAVVGDTPGPVRDRAILETLYASGMRISELVGLDRADVSLEDGLVRVFGKGAKERIVPIGRPARAAIDQYLANARPMLARATRRASAEALFLNLRGGRLTRQGCWGIVRAAAARAGLADRVSPHVLRHSCATHLLEGGADIRVVQEVLGHASVSTTQVYTKVSSERLRAVYDAAHPRSRTGPAGFTSTTRR